MQKRFFPTTILRPSANHWFSRQIFLPPSELSLLVLGLGLTLLPGLSGHVMASGLPGVLLLFGFLFAAMLRAGTAIVHHAEHLAERMGEPFATLLVTLSINLIEVVSIAAVMLRGANNPTLLRDSLLADIMLTLNGLVGLALLVGAWRHREQHYKLPGAAAYVSVLVPIAVLSLVLPGVRDSDSGLAVSMHQAAFLAVMTTALYGLFLALQTGRHSSYFVDEDDWPDGAAPVAAPGQGHCLALVASLGAACLLAVQISVPIDYFIEALHLPVLLGGMAIALLVALPEATGAIRAAHENRLQSAINILLGASLATIGITVPAVLLIGALTGRSVELGLGGSNLVMLELTLLVSVITFGSGRTSILHGAVHTLIFAAFLFLAFQP